MAQRKKIYLALATHAILVSRIHSLLVLVFSPVDTGCKGMPSRCGSNVRDRDHNPQSSFCAKMPVEVEYFPHSHKIPSWGSDSVSFLSCGSGIVTQRGYQVLKRL